MIASIPHRLIGLRRGHKRLIQLLTDTTLIILSLILAMALRLDGLAFLGRTGIWRELLEVLVILIPVSLLIFVRLGFYRAVVRYISSRAARTILLGVLLSALTLALTRWLTDAAIPRSVPAIYALIAFILIGGLRFLMRGVLAGAQARRRSRVIIYGAGVSGRQLQLSLNSGPEYLPVAFVDDDPALQGRMIGGCLVHTPEALPQLIDTLNAKSLLLAMPSLPRSERAALLRRLDHLPIHIQTIPGMADLVSGKTQINEITDVPIEDLLGRDPVPPRQDLMSRDLHDRVVMVTGAGGSIGSELCRQILAHRPRRLVLLEISEYNLYAVDQELQALNSRLSPPIEIVPLIGSVQDRGRVISALRDHEVKTIYHAAAYKHVPLVEGNVVEGIRNNVFGTRTLAEAAIEAGVSAFILISTDKAVRPTNIMGASKRLAELVCQALAARQQGTRFSMVRFGNVLGSSGSVIPIFRKQIAAGGPITVTDPEITRYFMTIPEAAQLVIQAGAMARGGDVFVLDMGEPIQIAELAARMARLSGLNPVIIEQHNEDALRTRTINPNDIEIRFTGLRPGEKLYEELLIDDTALPTEHPRIMTATEIALTPDILDNLLERLMYHCLHYDIDGIRQILIEAQTGYSPRDTL
ncbi:polysaccharide biosynthesis protein [Rhodobacter sp. SGA-6-6]|uniref:polysaccharide biosynthesis protein n=1 Tax=Rhodobacter sp. SGA-6-6 TaxID=2710882 RepID=UPI0013EB2E47|nr:nucleoside-diphosphate sugar epimerase/dehydratase [Rhodobacter sp. SGA-6-6]NGM44559.1 polysaccharide biosynthesis protein [Rhodobacter sp. SGA-6-6]